MNMVPATYSDSAHVLLDHSRTRNVQHTRGTTQAIRFMSTSSSRTDGEFRLGLGVSDEYGEHF